MKKIFLVVLLLISSVYAKEIELTPPPKFEPSPFTWNKWHEYFGIGAVVAGMVAGATSDDGGDVHKIAGITGALLADASVISGLLIHFDDINLDFGAKDPDNIHIALGLGGAALYNIAAFTGLNGDVEDSIHAPAGVLGTLMMMTSIYITW